MAQDNVTVITVHLKASGLPAQWLVELTRELVADHLAADATVYQRPHPDSGTDLLATLHTRPCHVERIAQRAAHADSIITAPLDCDAEYEAWILQATAA